MIGRAVAPGRGRAAPARGGSRPRPSRAASPTPPAGARRSRRASSAVYAAGPPASILSTRSRPTRCSAGTGRSARTSGPSCRPASRTFPRWAAHRARQHGERRGRDRRAARRHLRLRRDHRHLRSLADRDPAADRRSLPAPRRQPLGHPGVYARVGELLGVGDRGRELARARGAPLVETDRRVARVPAAKRPRVYYARGPNGLDTGLAARSTWRVSSGWARATWPSRAAGAWPRSRSSRCSPGTPR